MGTSSSVQIRRFLLGAGAGPDGRALLDETPPEGRRLLLGIGAKLEPILHVHPRPCVLVAHAFEVSAIGPEGERFGALRAAADRAGVPRALFAGVTTFVALDAIGRVVERLRGHPELVADGLRFSINVDDDVLASRVAAAALARANVPERIELEVHEELSRESVRQVLEWHHALGLGLALDDANATARDVRLLLEPQVRRVKCDFKFFQLGYAALDRAGDRVLAELIALARGRPLVIEGVEERLHYELLARGWSRVGGLASPPLEVQGYAVHPGRPWAALLDRIPATPPAGASADATAPSASSGHTWRAGPR